MLRNEPMSTAADDSAARRRDRAWWLMPRRDIPRRTYLILSVSAFALILLLWTVIASSGLVDRLLLPTPGDVMRAGYRMFTQLNFLSHIGWTAYRVFAGFILAAVIGIPLGIAVGTYRAVEAMVEPLMSFIRYMPASAFIPLFILWLGLGEAGKIAVIFTGTFFQLVIMVAVEVASVSMSLLESAYTLGASHRQVLRRILLPAALPGIVDTLRLLLGWAWTYIIVAELVGASAGIGHNILAAQRQVATDRILFGILTIGILGLMTDFLAKALHRRLFPWQ